MTNKIRTPDWEDLRSFIVLSRSGRLSTAARAMGVNHATVSRRLAALEAALGVELFHRRPQGYVLTQEGEAALAAVLPMERAALAVDDVQRPTGMVRGLVRVSTIATLGPVLIEGLAPLRFAHPELDFELMGEARNVSLALKEADIALRMAHPKSSDLIGRHVGDIHYSFYAAHDYGGEPSLIGYDSGSDFVPEAVWLDKTFPRHHFVFRSNTQGLQAAAARAGYGIALLPHFLGDGDAALQRVDFAPVCAPRELWLLTRADALRQDRVRVVVEALAAVCKEL